MIPEDVRLTSPSHCSVFRVLSVISRRWPLLSTPLHFDMQRHSLPLQELYCRKEWCFSQAVAKSWWSGPEMNFTCCVAQNFTRAVDLTCQDVGVLLYQICYNICHWLYELVMGRKVIRNKPSTLSGGVLRKIRCNTAAVCAGFIISSVAVFVFTFFFTCQWMVWLLALWNSLYHT